MPRIRRHAIGLLVCLLLPLPAKAADLFPSSAYSGPRVSDDIYDWTGLYAGAHGGLAEATTDIGDVTGAVGGAQAGYRLQTGDLVAGVEADMSLAGGLERSAAGETVSLGVLGSGRAIAGYALDKLLLYGTGGFGFGQIEIDQGDGEGWHGGWIVGVGAELALGRSWTARLEAFHYDIGDNASEVESNGIRAGVNYRF